MNRKIKRGQHFANGKVVSSGAQSPNDASAYFGQANTLFSARRFDDALASYNLAIAIRPNFPEAYLNRGSLLKAMGQLPDALLSYDKAAELGYVGEHLYYNRGVLLLAMGRHDEALANFDKAISMKPGFAEAHNNRGNALEPLGRPDDALLSYNKAIEINPNFAEAYNNRGNVLLKTDPGNPVQRLHRLRSALENYDKAIALKPTLAEGFSNRGTVLHEMDRLRDALESYDSAIALDPRIALAHVRRAVTLISLGEMTEAESSLRRALALSPRSPEALYHLAFIRKYDSNDVRKMESALQAPALPTDDRARLYFALGKINDDTRCYDKAFDHYRRGNDIFNETLSYDKDASEHMVDEIIDVFTKEYTRLGFESVSDSSRPLFIVGMPRSGTTLLATMLSNHPRVETAGELPSFLDFAKILPDVTKSGIAYPRVVKEIRSDLANELASSYMKRLTRDAAESAVYVIDKQPTNFLHLGFIAKLFPRARVIHCTRDAMDTGLSIYFQMFTRHAAWSFDLGNIGHLYSQYHRSMEHWRSVLPLEMIDVGYENVIDDAEYTMRRLLDFLELDWDPRCADPQANTGGVLTPSSWQVRQPINNQSVERWRRYEAHLGPLKEALAPCSAADVRGSI